MAPSILRDRITAELTKPGVLTPDQAEIVNHTGDLLVLACPGSGKTRTAGYRVARLVGEHGETYPVAATSYTNVAIAEIRRTCSILGVTPASPHFMGTLHSLLLSFVFRPFARLVMACSTQPMCVPTAHQSLFPIGDVVLSVKERVPLWNFTLSEDGTVEVLRLPHTVKRDPDDIVDGFGNQIRERKKEQFAAGFASFSDAMYLSMRTLVENPDVAQSLGRRFGEILVDEAQDTSGVQLRALQEIKRSGSLDSLVVIGDPDQAIYEWMGAHGDAFVEFGKSIPLEIKSLEENFRSSQAICNVSYRLSGKVQSDIARGPFRDLDVSPQLIVYPAGKPDALIADVEHRIGKVGLNLSDAIFLTRGGPLARKLRHMKNPDAPPAMRALATAKGEFVHGDLTLESLRSLEALLSRLTWGVPSIDQLEEGQRLELRDSAFALVRRLPELSGSGGEWIQAARTEVVAIVRRMVDVPAKKPSDVLKATTKAKKARMESFQVAGLDKIEARTIHSAKGETHVATILVADKAGTFDNAKTWSDRLAGEAVSEESRLAYVAVTRPQKFCAVAVPDSTPSDVMDVFVAAGFEN